MKRQGALRWAWRAVIFVIGGTVTLLGVVLFFTPGPAIVVIPIGLMILATEFAWARLLLKRVKARIAKFRAKPPWKAADAPAPADAKDRPAE